jgi:hypothetical protein
MAAPVATAPAAAAAKTTPTITAAARRASPVNRCLRLTMVSSLIATSSQLAMLRGRGTKNASHTLKQADNQLEKLSQNA